MITNVVVTYTIRPEALEEHVRLIEGVFAQLRDERPSDLEYKVLRLEDGVTFVHVSTAQTPEGANPLPALAAFKEFSQDLGSRVATQPAPSAAQVVGAYVPDPPVVGGG